jgi:S-layer protein (TIGR01567 family)
VNEVVEIRGEVVEPTSMQTPIIAWNTSNFAAFWYDLNDDVATETLTVAPGTLSAYDRTIDANHLVYGTTAVDVDFNYSRWGSYRRIGFMTEECFAGYGSMTDDAITDDSISLLSGGMLSKVLIDGDKKYTISTGASLQLEEDYELKIIQLDVNGGRAQIELIRNGGTVANETVNAPDTFVYTKDLGSIEDVPIIAIHVDAIFAGTETDMVVIDGIFQISENCVSVQAGDEYGEMEVTSTSDNRITMENYESLALREGKTINLMGDIKLVVADNETLRFAPVLMLTEPGTYEVRGAVVRHFPLV